MTVSWRGYNMAAKSVEMRKQNKARQTAAQFFYRHPYIAYWTAFVAMPIAALLAVMVLASVIILPVSFLFGLV